MTRLVIFVAAQSRLNLGFIGVYLHTMASRDISISLICTHCKMPFHPWRGRPESHFCSLKCNGAQSKGPRGNHVANFWDKVNKTDACWLWTGGLSDNGYGKAQFGTKIRLAHRISYELATGVPVPDGMNVCHSCDNKACVNPDHLWIGSQLENIHDMLAKERHNKSPNVFGEAHPLAKLTDAKVRLIRKIQCSDAEAARRFGVSPSLISLVRKRKVWRHV